MSHPLTASEDLVTAVSEYAEASGPLSLVVPTQLPFAKYGELVNELARAYELGGKFRTQVNFLIADALNQGEEMYGHEWSQVIGEHLPWSWGYVRDVMQVGRKIDPPLRTMRLPWVFYRRIYMFPRGDQERYIMMATGLWAKDPHSALKLMLQEINQEKIADILGSLKDDVLKDRILDVIQARPVTFHMVKRWADGVRPVPVVGLVASEVVWGLREGWVKDGMTPEMGERVFTEVVALLADIRNKRIRLTKGEV